MAFAAVSDTHYRRQSFGVSQAVRPTGCFHSDLVITVFLDRESFSRNSIVIPVRSECQLGVYVSRGHKGGMRCGERHGSGQWPFLLSAIRS